jgi:hypothetical protein
MASFTDTQLPKFNPYVQQLPIEEMKQVGMYKQQQYDQGVQKIQGYIDNVAGMSVSRDVDKQHLQSSLTDLGSKLKTVAAGDFSNHQLVNSVGGMATSIVKDPIIQAAVSSTANDKQQLEEMEADKKKGTLTPHAEYVYQLKRASYLNNDKLVGDDGKPITFGGKYIKSWSAEVDYMGPSRLYFSLDGKILASCSKLLTLFPILRLQKMQPSLLSSTE